MDLRDFKKMLLMLILGTILVLSGSNIFNASAQIYTFTSGVESGDVTSTSAVLWTRVDQDAWLKLYIGKSPNVPETWEFEYNVRAIADNDYTAKTTATFLSPNTLYYYRWLAGNQMSDVGQFRTAPIPIDRVNLHFSWSGDTDSSANSTGRYFGDWNAFVSVLAEKPDFFIYLGDVIYSDFRGWDGQTPRAPVANTLVDFRDLYKDQKDLTRGELSKTSIYALWDDHEVQNDWAGQEISKSRYRYDIGKKAFDEYMPIEGPGAASDPYCAGPTQFRVKNWGANIDLIILDTRSCRSEDAAVVCKHDLAPTLPTPIRDSIRIGDERFFKDLDPNCLPTINNPSRTMLGATQKDMFKNALLNSPAKFKIVVSSVNIQNTYALPYDNWEGYAAERSEILKFIRDNHIKNVIFLSTDSHLNLINEVIMNPINDTEKIADEIVTGPIAALTDEKNILGSYPSSESHGKFILAKKMGILKGLGVDCLNLNTYSYGSINSTATGELQIALKNDTGNVIKDEVDPSVTCTKTFR